MFSWGFILNFIKLLTSKSFYLHYLFGLNYWDTNTVFICVICFLLWSKPARLFFLLILNFFIKFKVFSLWFWKKQLPETLLIGTIVIHPLMFYIFMLIFLIKNVKLTHRYLYNLLPLNHFYLSLFLMITLFLGGFWGLQSTIWGYFWVNDSVEWLLLLAVLITLYLLHTFCSVRFVYNTFILFFFLINLIITVRLNIFQTRHSFIEQQSLSIVIVFGYFLVWEVTSRLVIAGRLFTHPKFKVFWIAMFFISFIFLSYLGLLIAKVLWTLLIIYFLRYLRPGALLTKVTLHLLIFIFFFVWNLYFVFFYLIYQKTFLYFLDLGYHFSDGFSYIKQFSLKNGKFKLLEAVTFSTLADTLRYFSIIFGNISFILLNNSLILFFFLILLLVKMVEFRLLHD